MMLKISATNKVYEPEKKLRVCNTDFWKLPSHLIKNRNVSSD